MVRARVLTIAMLVVIALGVAATVGLMKTAQTPARIPTSPAAGEDAVDFDERAPSPSPDERDQHQEGRRVDPGTFKLRSKDRLQALRNICKLTMKLGEVDTLVERMQHDMVHRRVEGLAGRVDEAEVGGSRR